MTFLFTSSFQTGSSQALLSFVLNLTIFLTKKIFISVYFSKHYCKEHVSLFNGIRICTGWTANSRTARWVDVTWIWYLGYSTLKNFKPMNGAKRTDRKPGAILITRIPLRGHHFPWALAAREEHVTAEGCHSLFGAEIPQNSSLLNFYALSPALYIK